MGISVEDLADFATSRVDSEKAETNSVSEVEFRAAVSRAYYAAFHTVLPFVELLPHSKNCPRDVSHVTHDELTKRLIEWKTEGVHPSLARMESTRNQLVNALQAARAARVKADYHLNGKCDCDEVVLQVSRWKRIKQAMVQIQNEINRSAANDS